MDFVGVVVFGVGGLGFIVLGVFYVVRLWCCVFFILGEWLWKLGLGLFCVFFVFIYRWLCVLF